MKVKFLNEMLKLAVTYQDLMLIQDEIDKLEKDGIYLNFVMKKSDSLALDFKPEIIKTKEGDHINYNRVNYITEDNFGFRDSLVRNLHKNIKISE